MAVVSIIPPISAPSGAEAAGTIPTEYINDETVRPLGAISVIGDSVMLGSLRYKPDLVSALADQGWGPIRARAGMGYSTGAFATAEWGRSSGWIDRWRNEGWDAPNVIVNLGVNDAGLCGGNRDCAIRAIDHLLDEIGPGHRVWWANITRSAASGRDYQAIWNSALDEVATRRPELRVWDWASISARGGFPSGDRIHLSPDGYRARNLLIAADVTETLVTTEHDGSRVALPDPLSDPLGFTAIEPVRVLDTRRAAGTVSAGEAVTVDLDHLVPSDTQAVAVNVTSTGTTERGYLTAYPCDTSPPNTSSVNHGPGRDRGALAVVPVSASRTLCVRTQVDGDVIVDLQGWFGGSGEDRFDPLTAPRRLVDTRHAGRADVGSPLQIVVPDGARAAAVTITATGAQDPGFLTAHPCGEATPDVSNVNYGYAEPVAGSAIVKVGDDNMICVVSSSPVDVIVDLTGTFRPDGANGFVPVRPRRLLDTRAGVGGWGPRHSASARIDIDAAPTSAAAVTGTLTIVGPSTVGFLTAEPCGATTDTSSVNAERNGIMANAVTVGTSEGQICVTSSSSTHTVFDLTGWWQP